MALIPKLSVCQPNDCQKLWLWDSTGTYDVSTNPGGYGAPNPDATAIVNAVIKVYPPGYSVPIVFTFTILTGVITAATRTDPNGTVTTVTSSLNTTAFPWTDTVPFILTSDLLNIGESQSLESGNWFFEYTITNNSINYYNTSTDTFIFCVAECCVNKMLLKVDDCDCGCGGDGFGARYLKAKALLDAAKFAAQWGLKEKAQTLLEEVQSICGSDCNGC